MRLLAVPAGSLRLCTALKINMEKMIVFCRNAVETLTYFSMQLADAFEAWGYEIFWMDFEMLGLSAWKLRQAVKEKEAVLITFNFIGLSGEEELWEFDDTGEPVRSLWEKQKIPCLNIMVDHPMYYFKALQYPAADLRTFCIDRQHVSYMKRFYPDVFCEFLPLAGNCGREITAESAVYQAAADKSTEDKTVLHETADEDFLFEQWKKRPYELVFTANYVPVSNIDRQLAAMDPEYRDFYYEMIASLIQHPKQDLVSCIEAFLRREIPDLDQAQLCESMSTMPAVDLWIRTYFREKTVKTLAEGGIKIHLFGKDWEKVSCGRPENLMSAGRMVDSAACVQAMAQAKIALNTMPWFKDGAHDRIFTAMLQGAASLTDDSIYLREQFQHMDTIVYYDLQNLASLPEQTMQLLADQRKLFELSLRAKAAARQFHMWKNRAQQLKMYI